MKSTFPAYSVSSSAYDQRLGQFLSADPFVKDPTNSQNYNRYAYCLNNPMKYTDPSGYLATTSESFYNFSDFIIDDSGVSYYIDDVKVFGSIFNAFSKAGTAGFHGNIGASGLCVNYSCQFDVLLSESYNTVHFNGGYQTSSTMYIDEDYVSNWGTNENYCGTVITIDWNRIDFTFTTTNRSNIKSLNDKKGDKHARVESIINVTAAYGLGVNLDYGMVHDSYGNTQPYFTLGWTLGYGASLTSGESISVNDQINNSSFEGWSSILSVPVYGPLSVNVSVDVQHGAENDYYGKFYQNIDYSIGPSSNKAAYINFSYTWLFIK